MTLTATHELAIDIGDMPILVRTDSAKFAALLEDRYGSFIHAASSDRIFSLDVELIPPRTVRPAESL